MTETTTTAVEAPQTGTPEANQISSTSMTSTEGLLGVGNDQGKVISVPEDSVQANSGIGEDWYWKEGLKGEGPRPDGLDKKYKTGEAAIKANSEAQKYIGELKNKLGAFADWKAPENYDFAQFIDNDFNLDTNHANYNSFLSEMRISNVPQSFADKMMGFFKAEMTKNKIDPAKELENLGLNGAEQVKSLERWAETSFSEGTARFIFKNFRTAEAIGYLKEIKAATMQSAVPTGANTAPVLGTRATMMEEYRLALPEIKKNPDLQVAWMKKFQDVV